MNKRSNSQANYNTINILKNATELTCNELIGTSYSKTLNSNGYPTRRFASGISMTLSESEIYTINIFNNFFPNDIDGSLEFISITTGAKFYQLQQPQPIYNNGYIVLDNALNIIKIGNTTIFNDLPVGIYKIIAIAYNNIESLEVFFNQKITDINFENVCLVLSAGTKYLEITPNCPSSLVLNGSYNNIILRETSSNLINSNQKFNHSSNVNYQAQRSIILESGFFVNKHSIFKAEIKPCQ